ncbi:MAG: hypothetical protein ACXVQ7_05535 [Actinomycetota bacterium]
MATKSKVRAKGGAAPGAPKPKIEPKKTPLLRRTWFRWVSVVVLVLVALWVSLFVWGRVSRASALRTYEQKLFDAARPFFQDIEQGDSSMQATVANFRDGKSTSDALAKAAAKWEADFTSARDAVSNLKPPGELKDAQATFVAALSDYVGVARFYVVVQKQRNLEDAVPAKNKKVAEDQVQLLLQHIADAQSRADDLYARAVAAINSLAGHWGVKTKTPLPPAPGQVPPVGSLGAGSTPLTVPS